MRHVINCKLILKNNTVNKNGRVFSYTADLGKH